MPENLFDFPDNAPIDEKTIGDIKAGMNQLSKELIINKIQEAKLLQQAQEEVGIGSKSEAIYNLMGYLGIGIRSLAHKVKVPRKKLVRMLEGSIPMPQEVNEAMQAYFVSENKRQKKNLSFDF